MSEANVAVDRFVSVMGLRWALGWRDRGHGHGDYCVITEDCMDNGPQGLGAEFGALVINDYSMGRDMCEHLIELHNNAI